MPVLLQVRWGGERDKERDGVAEFLKGINLLHKTPSPANREAGGDRRTGVLLAVVVVVV